jgi:hypothetical protein
VGKAAILGLSLIAVAIFGLGCLLNGVGWGLLFAGAREKGQELLCFRVTYEGGEKTGRAYEGRGSVQEPLSLTVTESATIELWRCPRVRQRVRSGKEAPGRGERRMLLGGERRTEGLAAKCLTSLLDPRDGLGLEVRRPGGRIGQPGTKGRPC